LPESILRKKDKPKMVHQPCNLHGPVGTATYHFSYSCTYGRTRKIG
jgi:hypothetical protein